MIFGDPYKFSILAEVVPEWSDSTYKNGMFHFFVDGKMFPDEIVTATLGVDLPHLLGDSALVTLPENYEIFHLNKSDAFSFMWRLTYPDFDADAEGSEFVNNSYLYRASTPNIDDWSMTVFCVRNNDECRILGAKTAELVRGEDGINTWVDISKIEIYEAFVSVSYVEDIVRKIRAYSESLFGGNKTVDKTERDFKLVP